MKCNKWPIWRQLAGLALGLMLPVCIWAQAFPNHPITMVVPFPPGGLADIVARPVAEAMGATWASRW